MTEITLEGRFFPGKKKLERALFELATSDMPLAFELVFVSQEQIRALNNAARKVDSVTDVLSFPALENIKGKPIKSEEHPECVDEHGRLLIGSVVVCKERAREQAEEYGHSYRRELCYLITHGVLHCLGYDHEDEEDKREMRRQEEIVMQKLKLGRGER